MDYKLTPVEKMMVKAAREFCDQTIIPIAAQIVKENDYPPDLMESFAKVRILGLVIPREYGGVGTTNLSCLLIAEELGKSGTGCFWPFSMNNSVAETILHWGTEEIKKKFIPPLCDGSAFASMAFTEPGTGSDPRNITMTAVVDGDDYILNGTKRFITNGSKPGYGVFYAKDTSLAGERNDITALIVDKSSPGYHTSNTWEMMGLDGGNVVDVFFRDVRIPKENVLGTPGKGFNILLRWIATERIQQAGYMVGMGQAALDESIKYVKQRTAGGKPIAKMQGIQWMLAEMKAKIEACRYLARRVACMQDDGERFEVASSELKVFVVPTIQEVTRMAVQLHGSYGYSKEYKVEKLFRDAAHAGVVATSTELNKTIAGSAMLR